ncbi:MAG: bifunctional lysine ketoglutarate reductase /saccharopine dehydrogenase family protein [Thermoanaerobaculia bacterium]
MPSIIGIRAEDKNRWERRAPLTPDHVSELTREQTLSFRVQPSSRRVFHDLDYTRAGAELNIDLSPCRVILGVKEIPIAKLQANTTYLFFSHTTKGQVYNMPLLRRLMDQNCTLIDYERITDAKGRRLIFFSRHAGYAGMIDTLWALGNRLETEGFHTPLQDVRLAHQYSSLDEATGHIGRIGERIRHDGLEAGLRPVVFAFAGSGNVSKGAQEVFDRLPYQWIDPEELPSLPEDRTRPRNVVYKTILDRSQRYERIDGGGFELYQYREHPELYRSALDRLLPHITVLVNGIYWEPEQPRLVTREQLARLWNSETQPKLRVIGDITCDIGGSIEATVRSTTPGDPIYVWEPSTGEVSMGSRGRGPVIMAVDNLPCELPVESSEHFGDSLVRFAAPLAECDWEVEYDALELPTELTRAVIVHRGVLTPPYRYLEQFVKES